LFEKNAHSHPHTKKKPKKSVKNQLENCKTLNENFFLDKNENDENYFEIFLKPQNKSQT
jgi:hypothetical protein